MAEFESVVDYSTKLENFEGPLDLLLHLVKEAKIEIKDIFVSEVTDQFLSYILKQNIIVVLMTLFHFLKVHYLFLTMLLH